MRTCYDRLFYKESEPHSFAQRYGRLYVLCMFLSFFVVGNLVTLYIQNRAKVDDLPKTLTQTITTFYPKELEFKFRKNELSINQPEPYYVGKNISAAQGDSQALLAIDTTADISDFDTYGAFLLALKKGFAFRQSNDKEVRFYSYSDVLKDVPQPFTFDYISYNQIVNKVRPFINLIPTYIVYVLAALSVFIVLFWPFFMISGVLFNLLFLAILGYFAGLIIKRKHTYGYVYKLGMYTAIPVILLQQVVSILQIPNLGGIWWLVALLFMVVFMPPTSEISISSTTATAQTASPMDPPKIT